MISFRKPLRYWRKNMQDKIIFREMLSEIKKLADEKGNRLTQE